LRVATGATGATRATGSWNALTIAHFILPLVLGVVLPIIFPAAAAAQAAAPSVFRWNDRPELRAGVLRLAFTARLQIDVPSSPAPVADLDDRTIDIARRRVGFEGRLADALEFEVDFETTDPDDSWRDAFVNLSQWRAVQVMAGKFKLPFSLDENTSSTNLDFVHRSLAASTLAPGRDAGAMVHGRLVGSTFRYELGTFSHDGSNSRPGPGSTRLFGGRTRAGRVGVAPFDGRESILSDLLVSAAWTRSDVATGFSSVRGETVFGARFYASDYWIQGPRRRSSVEMRWRPGPFSVKSEMMRLTEARNGQGVGDDDLSPLRAMGWYVSGTWAVTGEDKADGLSEPRRPLLRGGIGAVEIAARVERIRFDSLATGETPSTSARADVVVGNAARVMTVGVNWYVNRWIKMQFNLIREALTDPSQGPLPAQPAFWSRAFRLQFSL
jgi:phosphate-selective porin OprO/OprP